MLTMRAEARSYSIHKRDIMVNKVSGKAPTRVRKSRFGAGYTSGRLAVEVYFIRRERLNERTKGLPAPTDGRSHKRAKSMSRH